MKFDMEYSRLFKGVCGISVVILLAACQTTSPEPDSSASAPSAAASASLSMAESINAAEGSSYTMPAERIFAQGLDLYSKGQYPAAIRKFRSRTLSKAWPELRVRSLKYLAFSYCLSNQPRRCKKAFEDALQIDPKFELKPLERDHPMWGPVFRQAQSDFNNRAGTREQADNKPAPSEQNQAVVPSDDGSAPKASETAPSH
jgi:Tfp pilus assembly protein PilF